MAFRSGYKRVKSRNNRFTAALEVGNTNGARTCLSMLGSNNLPYEGPRPCSFAASQHGVREAYGGAAA